VIGNIGPLEIGVVLVIALVVFGPKRLPELGSSMGKSIRGFGKGLKGDDDEALMPGSPEAVPVASAEEKARSEADHLA
jgi:sec-independent protein translocase protein TatA